MFNFFLLQAQFSVLNCYVYVMYFKRVTRLFRRYLMQSKLIIRNNARLVIGYAMKKKVRVLNSKLISFKLLVILGNKYFHLYILNLLNNIKISSLKSLILISRKLENFVFTKKQGTGFFNLNKIFKTRDSNILNKNITKKQFFFSKFKSLFFRTKQKNYLI